jgi:hypothetical protein
MGIILLSVFLGLVAVAALSGTPAIAAYIIFPLSFGANSNLKLNQQSSITPSSPDTRTVEASTRYLAGPEPQLAPDLIHGALTGLRWFQGGIATGLTPARRLVSAPISRLRYKFSKRSQVWTMASSRPIAAAVGGPSRAATDAAARRLLVPRRAWSALTRTRRSAVRPARVAVLQGIRQAYLALPAETNPLGAHHGLRQFQ